MCWELLQSDEDWAILLSSRVMRSSTCINHHIFSSIWSRVKSEYCVLKENTCWATREGKQINFWLDQWCGEPLVQSMQLQSSYVQQFPLKLCECIQNFHWKIPIEVSQLVPDLSFLISQVTIPSHCQHDRLIWKHNITGDLSLKEAYDFEAQLSRFTMGQNYLV